MSFDRLIILYSIPGSKSVWVISYQFLKQINVQGKPLEVLLQYIPMILCKYRLRNLNIVFG